MNIKDSISRLMQTLFWEEKNLMSKFGRFTILSLLLVLALALVACGGGAQQATPTEVPADRKSVV